MSAIILNTDWTPEELQAYVCIFSMNADLEESPDEVKLIKQMVSEDTFDSMYEEFKEDNDYQAIQKIRKTIEDLGYTKDQVQHVFDDMKSIFNADNKFSVLERNLAIGLKRVLDF
ncbi:hypothetical protein [Tenacibaculum amylolyticum]|uniref:hypothetical protein n=1 Tax=Tenacibaculum amylolyticum TaxID=104269 RepID=UPI003892F17D